MSEIQKANQKVLLYDPQRCTGCGFCQVACAFYHFKQIDLEKAHLHVQFDEKNGEFEAIYCQHCDEPVCVAACPSEAIVKDEETGWVKINPARCIGCKTCVSVCPLSVPWFNADYFVSMKCDFCDGDPQCAMVCSPQAIRLTQEYHLLTDDRNTTNVTNEVDLFRCISCGTYFIPTQQIDWAIERTVEKIGAYKELSGDLREAMKVCPDCRRETGNIRNAKKLLAQLSSEVRAI